jgi:phenylpropionate dioxygenase-like ring-hydroxylating dioxygenase large terminal subunit
MIPNQWYVILESKELKNKSLKIKRLNETLALWRDGKGNVCCIADRCCHRGASLGCGKIIEGKLECPFHGFLYDKTGKVEVIPANGKSKPTPDTMRVKAYRIFEAHGFIFLWWGDDDKCTSAPFFFDELKYLTFSTFKDDWAVHYSRAIENQLDVVHLPFVHRTTIGRGDKTVVNGPVVIREGELITFYVHNIKDDGATVALKPDEVEGYERLFHLQFHYPNIWQNCLSDKVRIFAAFVPVDEENTVIYLRFYQSFLKFPLLKDWVNYVGQMYSKIILRQDKYVVMNQLPKKTVLQMDERLIMGDKPIIEYRKHRDELMLLRDE